MKTKFTIMLTAFLMLFCVSANAQALKGDVNGDGVVDDADIEEVVKIITGTSQLENPSIVGDVTGDGFVNVADIVSIVNIKNTPVANPAITFSVKIVNKTDVPLTLDGNLMFVLGNPDHNGNYLGWDGAFNHSDPIRFSDTAVTLAAGETKTFEGLKGDFMGEKSPVDPTQLEAAKCPRNVVLYVNGNIGDVLCDNMDTSIIFEEGGIYEINITSAPAIEPAPVDPNISINLNIVNQSGETVSLDGDVVFVLGNPDVYGNYHGWEGTYNRTEHMNFNTGALTLGSGESRVVTISGELGGRSPLNPSLLSTAGRPRNILLYVGGNSEIVLADNMDSGIVFQNGETYNVVISSASSSNPDPTPVNPTPIPGESNISINLNIVNQSGETVSLDGDVVFVLGNPDVYGNYHGWEGTYNRTDHMNFNTGALTLGSGESRVVTISGELGGRSPLNPSLLSTAGRPRNILLYVGGNSEIVLADNMDSGIVFQNGETYNVVITSVGSSQPAPTPAPSVSNIAINLNLINESGRAIGLDGDVVLVLGNPDVNGNYHGWDGPYNRTEHMGFNTGGFTLGAGESRVVTIIGELDGRSPLDPSWLSFAQRRSNVLLYVGGNSEIVIADNMDPNIVFRNGQTYNVVFR
jgi:hypothetical protein